MMTSARLEPQHVSDALSAGRCPLCDLPFADPDPRGRCDHEAGHYRDWLALFADALSEAEHKGER